MKITSGGPRTSNIRQIVRTSNNSYSNNTILSSDYHKIAWKPTQATQISLNIPLKILIFITCATLPRETLERIKNCVGKIVRKAYANLHHSYNKNFPIVLCKL